MSTTRLQLKSHFFLQPWFVITLICLIYSLVVISVHKHNPLALVTIGTSFSDGIAEAEGGTEGYDGQFVYFIARDASTAAAYITNGGDFPAYRFQRILLPWLGGVLAFGNADLIPWTLLGINLIALAAGTWALEILLVKNGVNRYFVIGYSFSLGVFGTASLSLPEPLAFGLVLIAILLVEREHWLWAAFVFALAALAKETTLLFVGGYGLYLMLHNKWRIILSFGAIAITPFIVWQLVLYDRLGSFGIGSGGRLATGFEIIPFGGIIKILTEGGIIPFIIFLGFLGPFVLLPTFWALWRCWQELQKRNFESYVLLLLANAGIMLFVPFSTYREPYGILRFIVGLQIAVILYAASSKSHRVLMNTTLWVWTMAFLVASDFSSESTRL